MPTSSSLRRSLIQLSVIAGLGLASVLIGAAVGYGWISNTRCTNNFEGGCGYASAGAALGLAFLVAIALFVISLLLYLKRLRASEPAARADDSSVPGVTHVERLGWTVTFWLVMVACGLGYAMMAGSLFFDARPADWMYGVRDWLTWPLLIAHCGFVYTVARRVTPGQELVWVVVAALYAPVTTAGVHWYLRRAGAPQVFGSKPA